MTSWSLTSSAYRSALHRLVGSMNRLMTTKYSCSDAHPASARPGSTSAEAISKLCQTNCLQTNTTWCLATAQAAPDGRMRGQRCICALSTSAADASVHIPEADSKTSHPDAVAGLTVNQRGQVDGFVTFLLQQNEKMNLTGRLAACWHPILVLATWGGSSASS
jgi:hypothetical protein